MSDPFDDFGPVIFSYTRAQALADGVQIDVSSVAKEAGFTIPFFITCGVFDTYVRVPEGVEAQDEAGRLWDVISMTKYAVGRRPDTDRLVVELYVRNTNGKARLVKLLGVCGPLDVDKPEPAITVMLPDEE